MVDIDPDIGRAPDAAPAEVSNDVLPSLRAVIDACPSAMVLIDRTGHLVLINRAFAALFPATPLGLVGRSVWGLLPMEVGVAALSDLENRPSSARPVNVPEQVLVDPVGNRRRIAWTISVVQDYQGNPGHLLATGVDVTRERTLQASWRERAETDQLTGLANRAFVLTALASYLDAFRGTGCGLLFADLDGFKAINDTHGHAVGDLVLKEVAARLTHTLRPDDIIARLGGDEFVVVVPAGGAIDAQALTSRIERALARPMQFNGTTLRVGVSIGTRIADPGEDPPAVLRDADEAMYQHKRQRGRGRQTPPTAVTDHGAGI
jgi:diguanylate cyclase (GGDEF)-like protein/PAS domain S-box-containing protein